MLIKNTRSTSSWGVKIPVLILVFYFLVILPCTQIFFHTDPWIYKYTDILFLTVVVIFVLFRFNLVEIGFSTKYLKQHLALGLISGGIMLLSVPILNAGLEATGLSSHKIIGENSIGDISYNLKLLQGKTAITLLIPLIEQIFFTGFLLQSLLKKINPILAVYIVSLIYSLTGFDLTLGSFILGIGTSSLFILTGTLYASILFHVSCAIGAELMTNVYPRLTVILGFLF